MSPPTKNLIEHACFLLALVQLATRSQASTTPGSIEVDLIFPQNSSYAPSPLMPIVFAVQNPALAMTLSPSISWYIEQQNIQPNQTDRVTGLVHLSDLNTSTSDPYFLHATTQQLNKEGPFVFAWELSLHNCSRDPDSDTAVQVGSYGDRRYQVYFSIEEGSSAPDLVAATSDDTCKNSLAQAVEVIDLLEIPAKQKQPASSCAVLPSTLATPSPCKVKIDSSTAESLAVAMTSAACAAPTVEGIELQFRINITGQLSIPANQSRQIETGLGDTTYSV
ncbi:hypothetical protein BJY04DRAFT_231178 [Aspergillus karnatakaensis]|uniref:uncharacterized protein n=1 Tax=Aspergillus karnatakaensis TaxID=1810916 RepID=UPI003CCE4220